MLMITIPMNLVADKTRLTMEQQHFKSCLETLSPVSVGEESGCLHLSATQQPVAKVLNLVFCFVLFFNLSGY